MDLLLFQVKQKYDNDINEVINLSNILKKELEEAKNIIEAKNRQIQKLILENGIRQRETTDPHAVQNEINLKLKMELLPNLQDHDAILNNPEIKMKRTTRKRRVKNSIKHYNDNESNGEIFISEMSENESQHSLEISNSNEKRGCSNSLTTGATEDDETAAIEGLQQLIESISSTPNSNKRTQRYWSCETCNKKFSRKYQLQNHCIQHEGHLANQCELCLKSFADTNSLRRHLKMMHNGEKLFRCEICDKAFLESHHLSKHKQLHASSTPQQSKRQNNQSQLPTFTLPKLEVPSSTPVSEPGKSEPKLKAHKCDLCSKSFSHRASLSLHRRLHTGNIKHRCVVCNKAFTRRLHLVEHERIHTGYRPHKCHICSKPFAQLSALRSHLLTHLNFTPLNCQLCTKWYTSEAELEEHMRIHSNNRRFDCKVCEMKFDRYSKLQTHMKSHASSESNEPSNSKISSEVYPPCELDLMPKLILESRIDS